MIVEMFWFGVFLMRMMMGCLVEGSIVFVVFNRNDVIRMVIIVVRK